MYHQENEPTFERRVVYTPIGNQTSSLFPRGKLIQPGRGRQARRWLAPELDIRGKIGIRDGAGRGGDMKGRVAVLRAYGGEFELREYRVPDPEPGASVIRLTRAGICGSDLHIWRGEMKDVYGASPRDLPFGHEMCGHVERLGAG